MTIAPVTRLLRGALLTLIGCALASCAVVTSEHADLIGIDGTPPQGLYYALPKALVDITLSVDQERAEFEITVSDPIFIPDEDRRYVMRYRQMPNYHDKIVVEVDPNTNFLKKVHSDTTDQTDDIIIEVAKAFTSLGYEAAPVSGSFAALSTVTVDPTNKRALDAAADAFRARAQRFAGSKFDLSCAGQKSLTFEKQRVCNRFRAIADSRDIDLVVLEAKPPAVIEPATPADCTVGLCYRGQEPWVIVATFDGRPNARILELPNKSVIVELDISRAVFVQKVQNIDFAANGQLKSVHIKKGSELETASALPIDIITAISKALPIRLTIREKQKNLAEKELAHVRARRTLLQKRSGPSN